MIFTMSPSIEGYRIVEYCGTVMALVSSPASNNYETRQANLQKAKRIAEKDMAEQTSKLGANAVISLSYNFVEKWRWSQYLFGSGTAVKIEKL